MNQKVVVIGHGYTSRLSIIRSVGMAGYEVDVVVIYYGKKEIGTKPIDCYSKYVKKVLYSPSGNEEALVQLLQTTYSDCERKPILVPESDFAVKALDANLDRLSPQFILPSINNITGAVVEWMDKQKQKERARAVGLAVAECTRISIVDGNYSIPEGIKYPCFPKPVDGGKKGLGRCDDKKALDKTLHYMATIRNMDVLVEDYLSIDKEYALVGFSDGQEVYIPAILHNEQMAHGGHFGVAKKGVVLSVKGYESLINKFKQLVLNIGFVGLFDIDFLECQGEFYFDEINLRFGGSGYAVTRAGANLPALMADRFSGNSNSSAWTLNLPLSFANERTCLDDWYAGFMSFKEYQEDIKCSDVCFINDQTDPSPYKAYKKHVRKMRFKHFIKGLVQK